MKFKVIFLTLLIVGLASAAFAADPEFTLAVNKDVAQTVAAGDSVVAGSFSVTNSSGQTLSIDEILVYSDTAGELAAADFKNIAVYEDININGLMDPGVDELVSTIGSAGATAFLGAGITKTVDIELLNNEKRYYIVVVAVNAEGATIGALDGKTIGAVFDVSDNDSDDATTGAQADAGFNATPADPTNFATVAIVASKLDWVDAKAADQIVSGGNVVAVTTNVIAAVDDYGNLDIDYTEAACALTAYKNNDFTAPIAVTVGAFTSGVTSAFGATTAGYADVTTAVVITDGAGGMYTIKAVSGGVTDLVGTLTVRVGAYPATAPVASTVRGAEYYDTDHNGHLDAVSVFFDVPVVLGATPKTAFTVTGYTIASEPVVKANNGGFGIYNGGEYAVTMELTELSTYDTDATPQITYDAGSGQISTDRNSQIFMVNAVNASLAVGDYVVCENGVGGIVTDITGRVLTVTFSDDAAVGGFTSAPSGNALHEGRTYDSSNAGMMYVTRHLLVTDGDAVAATASTTFSGGATATVVTAGANGVDAIEVYITNATDIAAAETYEAAASTVTSTTSDVLTSITVSASGAAVINDTAVAGTDGNAASDGAFGVVIKIVSATVVYIKDLGNGGNWTTGTLDEIEWGVLDYVDGGAIGLTPGSSAAVATAIIAGNPAASISAAGITEVDKAAPVVVSARTLDSGNGGTALNGKVDGIQIAFSEDVDGVTIAAGKSATGSASASLALNSTNQKSVTEILSMAGTKSTTDNITYVLPVTEGSFLTTDAVPYLIYTQQDGSGLIIVDNATNVNGVPARNQLVVNKKNTTADTDANITVKDAVSPVVLNVSTNDTNTNGKLDKFTVEYSEEVGIKAGGVTFVSTVTEFGTYTATTSAAVTGKIINYSVAEKGTGIFDTEAVPTFAYDPAATGTKLFDFAGNELAKYGSGALAQVNATKDLAAPIIVTVKQYDALKDDTYAGASAFEATGADGRLDKVVVELSEKATTTNYGTTANAANLKTAIAQFDINHEDKGGAGVAGQVVFSSPVTTDTAANYATVAAPGAAWGTYDTKAVPSWVDVTAGDTKTTITLYFWEVSTANLTTAGLSANGGDTGVILTLDYDKDATIANNFKDASGNTTPAVAAKAATDLANPVIVNGLNTDATWDGVELANIVTMDTDAITVGADYLSGDGYIDGFDLKFSEKVISTKADSVTMTDSWTIANGDGWSTITINKGLDLDYDGDVNLTAAGVADTSDDTAGAAGVTHAYLWGTSSKKKDKWDSGRMPTVKYNEGMALRDTAGNLMLVSAALPSYDGIKPVPALAVGGVDTGTIKVTWSEKVYSSNAAGAWGAINGNAVFGYDDASGANNDGLKASILTVDNTGDHALMTVETNATLTLEDVNQDSIWVLATATVWDDAKTAASATGLTNNMAEGAASPGVGFNIMINDVIAPYIIAAITVDADGDGLIDHIRFTFSEIIDDLTLKGYVSGNALSEDVSATWQLEGYTGTAKWNLFDGVGTVTDAMKTAAKALDVPIFSDNDANDDILYLMLEEDKVPASVTGMGSTGYIPVLTIVTAGEYARTLADNKPNLLDTASSESDAINSGDAVKDAVGPVLMAARYTSATTLEATFSEDVKGSTVVKEDFYWKVSTDGDQGNGADGYAQNVINITESAAGIFVMTTTDDYNIIDGWAGILKADGAITDDVKTVLGYSADNTGITAGTDSYAASVYYKLSSGAWVVDAARGQVAASVTIVDDWTYTGDDGGGGSVVPITSLEAPTGLAVVDVPGDQGNWFIATFNAPSDVANASAFIFARDMALNDADPNELTKVQIAAVPKGVASNGMFAVLVPSPINGVANWYVAASNGTVSSSWGTAKAGEMMVATLLGGADKAVSVSSEWSEVAVGGPLDNIAPAAVTAVAANDNAGNATGIKINWTASADDMVVGTFGSDFPIYGVNEYAVYRDGEMVGSVTRGMTSFVDNVADGATVYQYMVKSVDDSGVDVISDLRSAIATTDLTGDFTGDAMVDLSDFAIFGANYGKAEANAPATYVWAYDLNADGMVDLSDFAIFGANYGATLEAAKGVTAELPTADVMMAMAGDYDASTATYKLHVNIGQDIDGFEFLLSYDTNALEFAGNVTGLVGLPIAGEKEEGVVTVADVFVGEKFNGTVTLNFNVLGEMNDMIFSIENARVMNGLDLARVTDIAEFEAKPVPTVYSLSQNFPNPFNPTTTIGYAIPQTGQVELAIFNTAGQKVRTLVAQEQSAGFYKMVWDGRNEMGESVGSGVYIYRLHSGSFSKTAKMNLIK